MKESINHLLILSNEDEHLREKYKWVLYEQKGKKPSVVTYVPSGRPKSNKRLHLTRLVIGDIGKLQIEKLDSDIYNHRRENLRIRKYGDSLSRKLKRKREASLFSRSINRRMSTYLRNRLKQALKSGCKSSSAIRDLGCSLEEFKEYLSARFYDRADGTRMSFENYGEWHLDHIKPLSSFDLSKPCEQSAAVHFTNIQPLWREDNLRKGSRLTS